MNEIKSYTSTELQSLFRMDERYKAHNVLSTAEFRGEIPKAHRVLRGKVEVKKWVSEQLPAIGQKFGFIPNRKIRRQIISIFTQKGGVLKTTLSHALARILALHGYRVLVIGLDLQGSITSVITPTPKFDKLQDIEAYFRNIKGLPYLFRQAEYQRDISQIIRKTDLPTLDIIPETPDLDELSDLLGSKTSREFRFRDELIPLIPETYDVVLFDNGPNWTNLVKNSLAASTTLIQPLGCDVGTFQVLDANTKSIKRFRKDANIKWENWLLAATLLDNSTKLSKQIHAAYVATFPSSQLLNTPIRKSVKGQEALFQNLSAVEHEPRSDLARDYGDVCLEVWQRICEKEGEIQTSMIKPAATSANIVEAQQ